MLPEINAVEGQDGDEDDSDYAPSVVGEVGPHPKDGALGDYEVEIPQEFRDDQDDRDDHRPVEPVHEEFEEEVEKAGLASPMKPTAQEVEEHSISHVPYRSWCEHCVRGKARTAGHPSSSGEKMVERRPTVAMDYF